LFKSSIGATDFNKRIHSLLSLSATYVTAHNIQP